MKLVKRIRHGGKHRAYRCPQGKQKGKHPGRSGTTAAFKRLATIETDVPIAFVPEELVMEDPDCDALRDV